MDHFVGCKWLVLKTGQRYVRPKCLAKLPKHDENEQYIEAYKTLIIIVCLLKILPLLPVEQSFSLLWLLYNHHNFPIISSLSSPRHWEHTFAIIRCYFKCQCTFRAISIWSCFNQRLDTWIVACEAAIRVLWPAADTMSHHRMNETCRSVRLFISSLNWGFVAARGKAGFWC